MNKKEYGKENLFQKKMKKQVKIIFLLENKN